MVLVLQSSVSGVQLQARAVAHRVEGAVPKCRLRGSKRQQGKGATSEEKEGGVEAPGEQLGLLCVLLEELGHSHGDPRRLTDDALRPLELRHARVASPAPCTACTSPFLSHLGALLHMHLRPNDTPNKTAAHTTRTRHLLQHTLSTKFLHDKHSVG